ncbi:MAG: lysoplasmalogenase [Leptospira sp.]|nr:lysoplasmalogenase [Leptospira sp.]
MLITFIILSVIHLVLSFFMPESPYPGLTKGLPVLFLIICLYSKIGIASNFKKFVFFGLIFSLAGDLFLIFPQYFLPGLISFLLAHILYIIGFSKGARLNPVRAIPFYLIGILMFWYLQPGLKDMAVPVLIYMLALATMCWRASARNFTNNHSFYAGLVGATMFLLSDSILGSGKFRGGFPNEHIAIMFTYYSAQYLIFEAAKTE